MWRVLSTYRGIWLLIAGLCFSFNSFAVSKPQRIISLAPHLTELVYSLGAGNRLIATVDYADYPKAAKSLPRIGNYQYISLESILALQPDLVLVWQQGNQKGLAQKLAALNIAVYVSAPKTLLQLPQEILQLGRALGEPQQGLRLSQQSQQILKQLQQRYQTRPKVSVFYQLWHNPLRSISAKSWINDGIRLCGGENIMAEAPAPYPLLSEELVLAANPQAIIVAQWAFNHFWNKWPQLQAVQQQTIYHLDPDKAHRLTLRTLESLTELCDVLEKTRKKTHSDN